MQVKNPQAKWYIDLSSKFASLMQNLGMPDDVAQEIKTFMLTVARDQYMAGNKSGIRWARTQGQTSS